MFDGIDAWRAQTCPSDRREARRYKLNWTIRVIGSGRDCTQFQELATLQNLSSSGAYAYLVNSPPLGSKLSISVKLPFKQGTWMSYSAKAVRVEAQPAGIGVALKFDTSRPRFERFQD